MAVAVKATGRYKVLSSNSIGSLIHEMLCLVHRKVFGWATVGSIEDQRGVRHGTQLTLSSQGRLSKSKVDLRVTDSIAESSLRAFIDVALFFNRHASVIGSRCWVKEFVPVE